MSVIWVKLYWFVEKTKETNGKKRIEIRVKKLKN